MLKKSSFYLGDNTDNPIDDGKGESGNNETDTSVKDGFFAFFSFVRIAGRSHVINAPNDNEDYGDSTRNEND